jgi:hypothetical protein
MIPRPGRVNEDEVKDQVPTIKGKSRSQDPDPPHNTANLPSLQ